MLADWFRRKRSEAAPAPAKAPRRRVKVTTAAILQALAEKDAAERVQHTTYVPMPGVIPADQQQSALAMDDMPYGSIYSMSGTGLYGSFPGYPVLAELAQLPEYRKMVGTIADEMTRKWIKIQSTGEGDQSGRIKDLEQALITFKVREMFRAATEHDGFFGRGQIFIDVKKPGGGAATDDPDELKAPLFVSGKKIAKDGLNGFTVVEPMWTYPAQYNATNPLSKTFYRPDAWYVMGKTVHHSRFLMLIARPVPDMLKAVYSFGGLSLSQIAMPYVNNWIRTRDSVSDTVHSFSMSGIATNMESELSEGSGAAPFDSVTGSSLIDRAKLFNALRDNRGLMITDKTSEEFFQFNTPLSGLDALQAQSQEQMSAVSNIPLVKLLGIQPAGLNASSDGEIRVFYDWIHSQQEKLYREPLTKVMEIVQLATFGSIDPDLTFDFEPLYQLSDVEKATVRKTDAESDAALVNAGIVSAEEVRTTLAGDPDSRYAAIDLNVDPAPPDDDDSEGEEGEGQETADNKGAGK
jgi:hypothetical protein